MLIPQFWAEAKVQSRVQERQVTVRRFGWSDVSEADAQRHAEDRVAEAMARIESGETLPKYEKKVPYNGADGLPIREEIVARHGDVVVTRNSYGALCLNTPNVLFADVDSDEAPGARIYVPLFLLHASVAAGLGAYSGTARGFIIAFVVSMVLLPFTASMVFSIFERISGGLAARVRKAIEGFLSEHPGWRLRLYRTPAGYRILAVHQVFDPRSEEVEQFFRAMKSDPVYVRMCKNQDCFRARVSPKPWRIGIDTLRPRPGVWPIKPERMPQRLEWVASYESAAEGFAACRFEEEFGDGVTDYRVEQVQRLHDEYARAESSLPIA